MASVYGRYSTAAAMASIVAVTGGPVDPSRVDPSVCTQLLMPGVSPIDVAAGNLAVYGNGLLTVLTYPPTSAEPPLAAYAIP